MNRTVDIPLSPLDDSDNELETQQPTTEEQIDPSQLQWFPWMWFYVKQSAKKGYEVCDATGEKLAWFFGITKPKYYAEIQEYERMDEEEREAWRQEFQDVEESHQVIDSIVTQPAPLFTISNENASTRNM